MKKIQKLQQDLRYDQAILISDIVNINYLADLNISHKDKKAAAILITQKDIFLISSQMHKEETKRSILNQSPAVILVIQRRNLNYWQNIQKILPRKIKYLFIEEYDLKMQDYLYIRRLFSRIKLKPLGDKILSMREVKDLDEIKLLQKAQRLTIKILQNTLEFIKKNISKKITEKDTAAQIICSIHKLEDAEPSFEPIVATGANSAHPHHKSGSTKISQGVLLIDLGVRYKGYCGDLTRTFYIGSPDDEFKKDFQIVKEILLKTSDKANTSTSFWDLEKKAREDLSRHKLEQYFTHSLGHGIGMQIHEEPFCAKSTKNKRLRRNTVITIEPGIYKTEKYGIRLEDAFWVKKHKSIKLSSFPLRYDLVY